MQSGIDANSNNMDTPSFRFKTSISTYSCAAVRPYGVPHVLVQPYAWLQLYTLTVGISRGTILVDSTSIRPNTCTSTRVVVHYLSIEPAVDPQLYSSRSTPVIIAHHNIYRKLGSFLT